MGNRWGDRGNSARLYFGGSKITADGDCSHEIKRQLLLGRKVMINIDSILKSRDITLSTKVHTPRWHVGQPCGKDSRESLVGKPRGKATVALIKPKGSGMKPSQRLLARPAEGVPTPESGVNKTAAV